MMEDQTSASSQGVTADRKGGAEMKGEGRQSHHHRQDRHAYKGLRNQGSTCYLNSVLQVLFMTKDFREAVESHCSEDQATIDPQLRELFAGLIEREAVDTYAVGRKLGIEKVYKQQDAAEYYEKILSMTGPQASQIFHGQLTHRTTCDGCQKYNDANSPFWTLPLDIKDSSNKLYNVLDGIEAFFRSSKVDGDNQMYCEECDAKADATIECQMKHKPEVLTLLLKRFEFDYYSMDYVKIACSVDVPLTLPLTPIYELYAVVDHFGNLRGGHYTATIKSQDDARWYLFDDSYVTPLEPQPFQASDHKRSRSAYLLFYRKIRNPWIQEVNQDSSEQQVATSQVATSQPEEKRDDGLNGGEKKDVLNNTVGDISSERRDDPQTMEHPEPGLAGASSQTDPVGADLEGEDGVEMTDVDTENLSEGPEGKECDEEECDEEAVVKSDKGQREVDGGGDDRRREEEERRDDERNQASQTERREDVLRLCAGQYEGERCDDLEGEEMMNLVGAVGGGGTGGGETRNLGGAVGGGGTGGGETRNLGGAVGGDEEPWCSCRGRGDEKPWCSCWGRRDEEPCWSCRGRGDEEPWGSCRGRRDEEPWCLKDWALISICSSLLMLLINVTRK